MAVTNSQKQAAKQFVNEWSGKGYEKGETQRFWLSLLHNVFGIDDPMKMMEFELPVKTIYKEKGSDFIDGYITATKVLIEQKGSHVDLSAKSRQSDGAELTPFQQARRYAAGLPVSMTPRWIVACNFTTFEIHDMEHPNDAPEVIQLAELESEYHRLSFLVDDTNVHLKKELEVSIQAGEIVGVLYEKILAQYRNPDDPETQKALNKLCVRLVFCLYAEDAGIFGNKNMFHDYMAQFSAAEFREKLIKLFRILDQKPEERDPYEDEQLLAFPYVNGGMFAGDIEIPRINEEIRMLILQRASDDFDWSMISPTIFGAVFESTLNPETRRAGGMHYTSIENIHKVIDPLFLDDLKAELADIKATPVAKTKREKAYAFQDKISSLTFFDPACGSGNFLTESYTSLRRLENEALRIIYGGDRILGELNNPIKVSINQFYGIEINDFACSVTQTALWIAESQMMQETDEIVGFNLDPLPLKTYTNIHEGNALRMDWNDVIPSGELNYIMGNPPFVGYDWMDVEQKKDMQTFFDKTGRLDYVTAWYMKAADYIGDSVHCAFVSTNSIVQGVQVPSLWEPMLAKGIKIDFAYRTFKWSSESKDNAAVHCVIIGFSKVGKSNNLLVDESGRRSVVDGISPYLTAGNSIIVKQHSDTIMDVPKLILGSMAKDGGGFLIEPEEYAQIQKEDPDALKWIRRFMMGREFINNIDRYCIWLVGANPAEIRKSPTIMKHLEIVREYRASSTAPSTRKLAETPTLFAQVAQPDKSYVAIPAVSTCRRQYIPIGFLPKEVVAGHKLFIVPDAEIYHFGILTSNVHNAWMRMVAGRMKSDYSYTSTMVYNTFPWPTPDEKQRQKIEATAQAILDARALYPDNCLADLYDEMTMPPELRKAHRANDAAVIDAYGFPKDATDSEIVARLFKMYQSLTER